MLYAVRASVLSCHRWQGSEHQRLRALASIHEENAVLDHECSSDRRLLQLVERPHTMSQAVATGPERGGALSPMGSLCNS